MNWTDMESKDYLLWCLEGKALDFYTLTISGNKSISFRKIMKKLEARFGAKELMETSQVKFRQAYQLPEESLEDWADRVMTLATLAFTDLPEEHVRREVISRFCQGCYDKDAAKHACFENPRNIEEALNLVKQYQYISQAVDGRHRRKKDDISINSVQHLSERRVGELIASALNEFASKLKIQDVRPTPSSSPASVDKTQVVCFFCKNTGHFKRECKRYIEFLRKRLSSSQSSGNNNRKEGGALNEKGLSGKTSRTNPN